MKTSCSRVACRVCAAPTSSVGRTSFSSCSISPGRPRPGCDVLRWAEAPARCRHRSDAPPKGVVPRRADHRSRPGSTRRDVGRAGPACSRRELDDPAHDALSRGGRPSCRARRDHESRSRDRRRRAGRAEAGAPRGADGLRRSARRNGGRHRDRRCASSAYSRSRRMDGGSMHASNEAPRRYRRSSARSTTEVSAWPL